MKNGRSYRIENIMISRTNKRVPGFRVVMLRDGQEVATRTSVDRQVVEERGGEWEDFALT